MAKKFHLPTEGAIRAQAYQIYLERGCEQGHEVDDWEQAEYELMQLPLRTIAKLDAIVVEEANAKKLRLFALAQVIPTLKRQSSKQFQPRWNPSTGSSTAAMASAT